MNRGRVRGIGGSEAFKISLKNELEKLGFETNFTEHGTYYRVYVSGRKTIKLFSNWLYKDKGLFLKRKFDEFQLETLPCRIAKRQRLKST